MILKIKDENGNWVGIPVCKGDTGDNAYVHIKYSANQPTADSDMTDTPSPWIGLYSGTSATAPTHYTDYEWYKFKGETGATGQTGATGATPAFSIGTVSTLSAGASATASITGTAANPVLNLGIPKGDTGATGTSGADPFAFTVTLAAANWSAGAQTVSNANFLTGDYCYMVYASPSSTYAWQDADVYADDVTTAGQMTFHCDVTPSADIVANVIRLVVDT